MSLEAPGMADDAPADARGSAEAPRPASKLSKHQYMTIRAALDFRPAIAPTLAILAYDLALVAAAVVLLRQGSGAAYATAQCLLAIVFFNSFSLLHECGHGTVSRSTFVNTLVGHYASIFCFLPYFPWKYIHQQHHVWTGNLAKDPTLAALRRYRDTRAPLLVRAAWWTWIPISAFVQHLVFVSYPYLMWRTGDMTAGKLARTVLSVLWLPVSYALLWWLAPDIVRPRNIIPAFVLYLFLEELINLPHHVDRETFEGRLPLWEQYRAARSCYYPRGISELIMLNFNFHIEHHLFPSLPWYRLRKARHLVKPALGDSYEECIGISWNLSHRTRDIEAIIDLHRKPKAAAVTPGEVSSTGRARRPPATTSAHL
jgi:acyl-lipid omega-6 desaturase (Delta-12 desaturase)